MNNDQTRLEGAYAMRIFNIVMAVSFTVLGFSYLITERDLQWWAASILHFAVAINFAKDTMRDDR
jgi:hypothetical protein